MADRNAESFIIAIEGSLHGRPIAIVAGVEVAIDDDEAFHNAVRRFPPSRYLVLPPIPWENVDPEIRLRALEADRLALFK